MKIRRSFIFTTEIIFILSVLVSCTDEWRRTRKSEAWKSSDPLSIPYNIRMKEFKSGNLVPNPSFEDGTPRSSDTSTVQTIKKWEIIGKNVRYAEDKKDTLQLKSRNRFVYVHREYSDETDTIGEGVLSEFIPVIPGNYCLKMRLKAENIRSQFQRFGNRLHDAINIRLFFYNNRREEIKPSLFYPPSGNIIDMSFRGMNFARLYAIDEMPWTEIHARSGVDPMMDGDIPDECRFVRIFIGLKGTGSLWIDDVHFSYSKLNFSAKERINKITDSAFSKTALIIPTPQFVQPKENIPLISAGFESIRYPAVILDKGTSNLNIHTQKFLAEKIEDALRPTYPECSVIKNSSMHDGVIDNASVIFLLTSYQAIDTLEHAVILPGFSAKDQGYVITDTIIDQKRTIILAGKDDEGLFYAASTLVRLLDPVSAVYHHAQVIDFPYFTERGFQLSPWNDILSVENDIQNLDFLTYYRFNRAYIPVTVIPDNGANQSSSQIIQFGTKQLAQYAIQKETIKFGVQINPYAHLEFYNKPSEIPDSLRKLWMHDEQGIATITEKIKPVFDQDADFLMLTYHEFLHSKNSLPGIQKLWTEEDILRHSNLYNAQTFLIKQICEWLIKNYGTRNIMFASPENSDTGIGSDYGFVKNSYKEHCLIIPHDAITFRDFKIHTQQDVYHNDSAPNKDRSKYIILDNTMSVNSLNAGLLISKYFPGKIKLMNIFEPYEMTLSDHLSSVSGSFYTTLVPNSEIAKIKIATLSDYLWNPKAYNPEVSLWKILTVKFGKDVSLQLIEFNDLFFKVYANILTMEKEGKEAKSLKKNTEYAIRKLFLQLETLIDPLNTPHFELFRELELLCTGLKDRLDNLQPSVSEIQKTESTSRVQWKD